ncbi:cell filamentation protein Fic [Lactobacillus sp. UMNPBX10]|nr:cell filamentation protein Fic [Limosilactobacillus reuteri]PEG78543.1 cell filamentation protein Fic [Lactobacillus sp. UMNPBX18]PEG88114.1 cell filamentation protein Fic [Lactobacillus sp. UMNPBX13]PEG93831.1 cell filamentation protein Fic [Lactobacillus sp. UMNPBX10]PEH00413.1 cell filamentation protein Fic [Lactobacillus sp. UMNPBX7]PEH07988.1 cell filamentation protein Fic [Lactobacillus sp. UMNPBX3]
MNQIYNLRGKTDSYETDYRDTLDRLVEVAKIQSTSSSNRIEGIYTTDERMNKIMQDKTQPRNRDEKEISGYRDVLKLIHEQYDYIPISVNSILEMHKRLFAYTGSTWGGNFKDSNNKIVTEYGNGKQEVRFNPPAAYLTPELVRNLCDSYNRAIKEGVFSPLLLSGAFIFDFVSIHPFNDGNGRMSRLLMLLTMYKAGFDVGKYISIEKSIEETKSSYYQALKDSSEQWMNNKNDYLPFLEYFLGIILKDYREFNERLSMVNQSDLPVDQLVLKTIRQALKPLSIKELNNFIPQYSEITIRRAVKKLRDANKLEKIGQARSTKYGLKKNS